MKLIYIIENGNRHKKIGVTANIQKRMAQLNTAMSTGIRSVIISDFTANAYALEKQLHEANKEHRLNGEWFREIFDFCEIEFSRLEPKIKNTRWMMTFQDSLEIIATDSDMTGQSLKVMLLLMGNLEFENYITIKQVTIAEKLNMYAPDVSKAMRLLVSKGIILKVKEGTTTAYKLNSDYGWKGKVSNMDIEKERVLSQKIVDMDKIREFNNPRAPDEVETDFTEDDIPY